MPPLVTRKQAASFDEGDLRSRSEIGSAVPGAGVVGTERICTDSRSSPTLSALMTHEMDPTVKIWAGYGRDKEPTEKAILFDRETTRKPLPGTLTVDKISPVVLQGVFHEGRLISRGA